MRRSSLGRLCLPLAAAAACSGGVDPAVTQRISDLEQEQEQEMMGALLPYKDGLYVVTCFASAATFSSYEDAFRRSISSFDFKVKNQ